MPANADAEAKALLTAKVRGVCYLVDLNFINTVSKQPEPLYLTTWPENLTVEGRTYIGLGKAANVSQVTQSENISAEKVTLTASATDQALVALVLGNVEAYRNRTCAIRLQLLDETFVPRGAPVLCWRGFMDRIKSPRKSPPKEGGMSVVSVELECSRTGMARSRRVDGARLTHEQQIAEYPGDLGLSQLAGLVEKPAQWLSKAFQRI